MQDNKIRIKNTSNKMKRLILASNSSKCQIDKMIFSALTVLGTLFDGCHFMALLYQFK